MSVETSDGTLFFILSIDNTAPRKYQLSSFSKEEVVFENPQLTFPNQVILRFDNSTGSFTTIYQNSSPYQLDERLQKSLEQRNEISSEQIKRVMIRKR